MEYPRSLRVLIVSTSGVEGFQDSTELRRGMVVLQRELN